MKRYFGIFAAVTLLTFFLATLDSDANGRNGKGNGGNKGEQQRTHEFVDTNSDGVCDNFVDANGDGVCDNCTGEGLGNGKGNRSGQKGSNYVDADGNGVCDNFIDEDGDGVCDHCKGNGLGNGSGSNFVDADGDGVCDNFIDEDGDGVCDHCMGERLGNGNKGNGKGQGKGNGGNGKRLRDGSCDLDVEQNYPNPFYGSTTINVNTSNETPAKVVLYDEVGNKVADVYEGNLHSGANSIEIMPENLKPGIYYYQVNVNGNAVTKRLLYGNY